MSPIRGLTHQQPQFPQIGQLRKGIWIEEERRAKDLDYFRFTSDIPEVVEAFVEAYGEQPRLINVFLPHKTTDENWEGWMEEYVASGLIHRCDGEYVVRYRDRNTGKYVDPPPDTMKCPYESGEKERTKESPGCKPQGRLQVVVRELKRFAYVMVITTSWNDIKHLDAQLRAMEEVRGDLRNIPLQLRRQKERISTPQMKKEDGQWVQTAERARRESWLLSIEIAPKWADMRMEQQRIEALPIIPKQLTDVVEAEVAEMPPEEEAGEDIARMTKVAPGTYVVDHSRNPDWQEGDLVSMSGLEEPPPTEDEHIEESIEPEKESMTLGQALGIALHTEAPKLGLEKGDYLLEAVKLGAKDLIEYLCKSSSYQHQTVDGMEVQRAAKVILDNWDAARVSLVGSEEAAIEEIQVDLEEGGETAPLF